MHAVDPQHGHFADLAAVDAFHRLDVIGLVVTLESKADIEVLFLSELGGLEDLAEAEAIAGPAVADFIEGRVDSVQLVYNEFKSVMQQRVVVEQLLPLAPIAVAEAAAAASATDYLYEPSPQEIFDVLLGRLVEAQVLGALLESTAAFFAAQMTAMDAATRNSKDMIDSLTLTMNKVRQAAITREIIEVVSGAQAL